MMEDAPACELDLPGFTTAMDGGSAAIGREPMRPTAMDGSSKNLEGLISYAMKYFE
jgi:hypothetical protein